MQHDETERLKRQNAGAECDHDEVTKEYYFGAQTGDWVCKTCGESFSPSELSELREEQGK
jgi:hypothetical protein